MKMKIIVVLGLLLVMLTPSGLALGGNPATVNCSTANIIPASLNAAYTQVDAVDMDIDASGNLYLVVDYFAASIPSHASVTYKYSPTDCSKLWHYVEPIGTTSDLAQPGSLDYDEFGTVWTANRVMISSSLSVAARGLNAITGAFSDKFSEDFSETMSPAWTNVEDIDTIRVSSTEPNYLALSRSQGRIARFGENFDTAQFDVGVSGLHSLRANGTSEFFSTACDGTNCVYAKRDATTGAALDSVTRSNSCFYGTIMSCGNTPLKSQTNQNHLTHVRYASRAPIYDKYRINDMEVITDAQGFTPAKIAPSGSQVDMDVWDYDVDGAGELLVCGEAQTANSRSFVAHYKTSNNTEHWNLTYDLTSHYLLNGNSDTARLCKFDRIGGFWVVFQRWDSPTGSNNVIEIKHYLGGDFIAPSGNPGGVIPTGTPPASNTNNPIGQAVTFASNAWGFNWAPIFGLVLVGGILFLTSKQSRNILVVAIIALIAVIIAVTLGLLPTWLIFLVALLCIGFVAWAISGGRSETEE